MKTVTTEELDTIICDKCHKDCRPEGEMNILNASLKYSGCYGSKYDLSAFDVDLCEECWEQIMLQIFPNMDEAFEKVGERLMW